MGRQADTTNTMDPGHSERRTSGDKKCLERRLGLTGDIEADLENLSPVQGKTLSQNVERTNRINLISFLVRDILMPIFNNISDISMIIFLWRREDKIFAYMTLALFYLPTVFLLVHYATHFRKTNLFAPKLLVFSLVGPSVDWIINISLIVRGKTPADFDDKTKRFLDIIKVVNGVIESSFQLVWTVVLICLEVSPLPWADMTMVKDILGNTFPLPVSSLSLIFSVISIVNQLTFYWRNFGLRRKNNAKKGPEDVGDVSGTFLVYPIVVTHLVFRVGVLAIVSLFSNIYSVTLLGLSLISYSIIRMTRTCHEQDSVLGEAVASLANSLLLIPTSTDHRSHNLYLLHDGITNVFMMTFIISIQIINFDYDNPLFVRPNTLIISHRLFIIFIFTLVTFFSLNYLLRFIFFYINQNCEKKGFWKRKMKLTKLNIAKALLFLVNLSQVLAILILALVSLLTQPVEETVSGSGECGMWIQSARDKSHFLPLSCDSHNLEFFTQVLSPDTLLNQTDCLPKVFLPSSSSRTLYEHVDVPQDDITTLEEESLISQTINNPTAIICISLTGSIVLLWTLILWRSRISKLACKYFDIF